MISKRSQPLISIFLRATQFEIDAAEDYKKIPAAYKNYYIVRSNSKDRVSKKDDVMIPHCAAFEADSEIKEDAKHAIKMGKTNDCLLSGKTQSYF